jgi:uncharacterized protein (DUF2336 family)
MMSTLESVVREMEQAIATWGPERRARPLRKVTELFVEQAPKLKDDHVSVFDEVIIRLAREVGGKERSQLSQRLADIRNAPVAVVKNLAQDADLAVAEPILERSTRLSDDDLVAIAAQKEQGHLLAVSRRRVLSERVTGVLVERGDQQVVRAVAQNQGAKLSEGTLANLAKKAAADTDLRSVLMKRADVPPGGLPTSASRAPLAKQTSKPKAKTMATAETQRLEAALSKLAASMNGPPPSRDVSVAVERLARTANAKGVQEVRVANWIKADKVDDALAALVHNSGLPASAIVSAYESADYEPLLLMVRAARLSWNIFKLLLTARDGKVPPADLVKASFESFQQLPVTSPQQLKELIAERQTASTFDAA